MFAGHLPMMHFDLAAWQAMPVAPTDPGMWPGEGFFRASCRGRPIVFYVPPLDSGEVYFAVRPIVRVKMGRRVVSQSKQFLYEWWADRMTPSNFAKLMAP